MTKIDDRVWASVGGPVLLAGDAENVPEMCDILARLPHDAHTTVLIEVFAAAQIDEIPVPGDIRVTWLVRSNAGADRDACAKGARLAAAIHAWCAEWACSPDGRSPACTVWLGARTPARIVRMTRALIDPRGAHTPPHA